MGRTAWDQTPIFRFNLTPVRIEDLYAYAVGPEGGAEGYPGAGELTLSDADRAAAAEILARSGSTIGCFNRNEIKAIDRLFDAIVEYQIATRNAAHGTQRDQDRFGAEVEAALEMTLPSLARYRKVMAARKPAKKKPAAKGKSNKPTRPRKPRASKKPEKAETVAQESAPMTVVEAEPTETV